MEQDGRTSKLQSYSQSQPEQLRRETNGNGGTSAAYDRRSQVVRSSDPNQTRQQEQMTLPESAPQKINATAGNDCLCLESNNFCQLLSKFESVVHNFVTEFIESQLYNATRSDIPTNYNLKIKIKLMNHILSKFDPCVRKRLQREVLATINHLVGSQRSNYKSSVAHQRHSTNYPDVLWLFAEETSKDFSRLVKAIRNQYLAKKSDHNTFRAELANQIHQGTGGSKENERPVSPRVIPDRHYQHVIEQVFRPDCCSGNSNSIYDGKSFAGYAPSINPARNTLLLGLSALLPPCGRPPDGTLSGYLRSLGCGDRAMVRSCGSYDRMRTGEVGTLQSFEDSMNNYTLMSKCMPVLWCGNSPNGQPILYSSKPNLRDELAGLCLPPCNGSLRRGSAYYGRYPLNRQAGRRTPRSGSRYTSGRHEKSKKRRKKRTKSATKVAETTTDEEETQTKSKKNKKQKNKKKKMRHVGTGNSSDDEGLRKGKTKNTGTNPGKGKQNKKDKKQKKDKGQSTEDEEDSKGDNKNKLKTSKGVKGKKNGKRAKEKPSKGKLQDKSAGMSDDEPDGKNKSKSGKKNDKGVGTGKKKGKNASTGTDTDEADKSRKPKKNKGTDAPPAKAKKDKGAQERPASANSGTQAMRDQKNKKKPGKNKSVTAVASTSEDGSQTRKSRDKSKKVQNEASNTAAGNDDDNAGSKVKSKNRQKSPGAPKTKPSQSTLREKDSKKTLNDASDEDENTVGKNKRGKEAGKIGVKGQQRKPGAAKGRDGLASDIKGGKKTKGKGGRGISPERGTSRDRNPNRTKSKAGGNTSGDESGTEIGRKARDKRSRKLGGGRSQLTSKSRSGRNAKSAANLGDRSGSAKRIYSRFPKIHSVPSGPPGRNNYQNAMTRSPSRRRGFLPPINQPSNVQQRNSNVRGGPNKTRSDHLPDINSRNRNPFPRKPGNPPEIWSRNKQRPVQETRASALPKDHSWKNDKQPHYTRSWREVSVTKSGQLKPWGAKPKYYEGMKEQLRRQSKSPRQTHSSYHVTESTAHTRPSRKSLQKSFSSPTQDSPYGRRRPGASGMLDKSYISPTDGSRREDFSNEEYERSLNLDRDQEPFFWVPLGRYSWDMRNIKVWKSQQITAGRASLGSRGRGSMGIFPEAKSQIRSHFLLPDIICPPSNSPSCTFSDSCSRICNICLLDTCCCQCR